MQETSRYAVGIDVGTTNVRCVVGHIDATTGAPTIVGVGQASNSGMRKGVVANLTGPAQAIDDALGEAERMSGYQVNGAALSINGSHILSTTADGMIAVGAMDHEIVGEDLRRIEEVATLGKVPANREILEVVPHSYRLDGQDNIKDPLGMTGTRLEINANVVSALAPHLANLQKSAEMAKVEPHLITPAILAAARAVLNEQQLENGVAVVDLGGATTSVAVFEEGDLQYVGVIPMGGVNITNDLAIGLKTDPEIAEQVKLAHAVATTRKNDERITVKQEKEIHTFDSTDVDEIVEARLDEIFEAIQKELKKAGRAGKLPSGVVLTGGSAKIKGMAEYTKQKLGLAARVGKSSGYGGVAENIEEPQFATAVGLMLLDAQGVKHAPHAQSHGASSKAAIKNASGMISKFLDRFKA
jgi:cell division protein FtsA